MQIREVVLVMREIGAGLRAFSEHGDALRIAFLRLEYGLQLVSSLIRASVDFQHLLHQARRLIQAPYPAK